jgi:hypothetical protein
MAIATADRSSVMRTESSRETSRSQSPHRSQNEKPKEPETKATASGQGATKASTEKGSEGTKTVRKVSVPGTTDRFAASNTSDATRATKATTKATTTASTRQTQSAQKLPPAAQAAVDQARQAQTTAQTAAADSMKADQRVRDAQAQLLRAQQAATLARKDLDKGYQGHDPAGTHRAALKETADNALEDLKTAHEGLLTAQAEAASASEKARKAATSADQATQRLEQLARQDPGAAAALNAAAADTRRASAAATRGAAIAGEAAKPQPMATVSYDLRFGTQNNGGQHDIVFDGAVVGANGQVYPPGTDASQAPGVRPNDGTPFTGERIYYVNGIQNTASFQSQSIQNIANATGGEVVGIHNSTEGLGLDLQQCVLDKLPSFQSTNAATRALANQIVKDIEAGRPVHLMAHSQGGLVTSGALTIVKDYLETMKPANKAQADAILKNIKVETFGSAAASWPYGPQYTHYINENDTVPMITGLGRQADPARQQNAGGDRATIHFIRDDPRTPDALRWSPETNALPDGDIPAHDFNDGYLFHRQPWEQGHANSADLTGASPVQSRDPQTNELQGYYYYQLDSGAPSMQQLRDLRNGYEQVWQTVSSAQQAVTTGLSEAGQAVTTGLNQANEALTTGLNQASEALIAGLNQASDAAMEGLNQAGQAVTTGLDTAGQAVRDGVSTIGSWLNPWD